MEVLGRRVGGEGGVGLWIDLGGRGEGRKIGKRVLWDWEYCWVVVFS
jgi:hypothetical protein